jgi:hypothetical protein
MGRVAIDFGGGQGASAAPISAAISVKRATPASGQRRCNLSGARQKGRLAVSLVRCSPPQGMRLARSLPFAPSASTRDPFQYFNSLPDLSHFNSMTKLFTKLKEEFFRLLPPTIFFFVALHIVALVHSLMMKAEGISALTSVSIAIAALVMGKSVLLADLLPIINRFPDKPLIYNVTWKSSIYVLVSLLIHYLEHLIDFWRQTGGLVAGNKELWAEIVWPHFWAIQIMLLVLIIMYCTMHELVRVIGREKVLRIFFGPMPSPQV